MKPIMESWRGYLTEGQGGTAFEHVVVAVAQGKLGGGKHGNKIYGAKKPTKKNPAGVPGEPYRELAFDCLREMGYSTRKITAIDKKTGKPKGIDPNAKLFSAKGTGISGLPKTDIIIAGKRISLKLRGAIQLTSGEAASTLKAIDLALAEYLEKQPKIMNEAQTSAVKGLKDSVEEFNKVLGQTIGKRYLPVSGSEEYLLELAKKAKKDWTGNEKNPQGIWPSAGIPKQTRDQGPPQIVYPGQEGLEEYIKYYQKLALVAAWNSDKLAGTSYKNFKSTTMKDIEKKVAILVNADSDYYNIIIDEWFTGRRQFKGTDGVAEYLLSPDGFYPIKTTEQTAALIDELKDYIHWRPAAKGRSFLSKAIAFRVDFKAEKYYAALRKAAEAVAARAAEEALLLPPETSGSEWQTMTDPKTGEERPTAPLDLVVNEGRASNSEVENIAQQMARELMPDVHLEN